MLSLLTCSAPPLDEFDPYESPPPSPSPARVRRASRTLSFIRTPSKRKVSKMSIGAPANFRHEFHLGMDIVSSDSVSLWDATRFLEELRAQRNPPSTASTSSQAPSARSSLEPPPASLAPPCTPRSQKRNSITPQKRKPVPSLVPEAPPRRPADIPLPPSPLDVLFPTPPADVPLPPSPTSDAQERRDAEIEHALRDA